MKKRVKSEAGKTPCKSAIYKGLPMGPTRFELVTSSLSGTRSNQLSYEPGFLRDGKL